MWNLSQVCFHVGVLLKGIFISLLFFSKEDMASFSGLTPLPLVWVPMHLSPKLFRFPVHFQTIIFLDLTVVSPVEPSFNVSLFGSHDTRLLDSDIPHGCALEPLLPIGAIDELSLSLAITVSLWAASTFSHLFNTY